MVWTQKGLKYKHYIINRLSICEQHGHLHRNINVICYV